MRYATINCAQYISRWSQKDMIFINLAQSVLKPEQMNAGEGMHEIIL